MLNRKRSLIQITSFVTIALILLTTLIMPTSVRADDTPPPHPDNGTCITCHEDLYLLHDTGNWFCLRESPMTCVGCHGGNPATLDKESAHSNRTPHPVLNDDVSKCQECHPEQCTERVAMFKETAGISNILVAVPYTPASSNEWAEIAPISVQEDKPTGWLNFMEIAPILVISGIMLIIYFSYRFRHTHKDNS